MIAVVEEGVMAEECSAKALFDLSITHRIHIQCLFLDMAVSYYQVINGQKRSMTKAAMLFRLNRIAVICFIQLKKHIP